MGIWVCRDKVFWRDKLWSESETLTVEGGRKWEFSHGWWVVEGKDVIDESKNEAIPGSFEPMDFSELVDKRQVYNARNETKVPRTWQFKSEVDSQAQVVDIDSLPDPEPITPSKIIPPVEPPDKAKTRRRGK